MNKVYMKVIGISSSGRKGAYSKIILNDMLEESGVDFEMIHLSELNITGCLGCLKCAENNRCVQKDEFHTVIDKIIDADALVFGGANYYGTLNAIGHSFWERTFALRHRGTFPLTGKMEVIASLTVSGHQQCYDCGYGHECLVGNVYSHCGLTTAEHAESMRPVEYGSEDQKEARAIGKMLGLILNAKGRSS